MKDGFGTTYVTSLNVAEGANLVRDDQLRESFNGWTDEDGVWSPAKSPVRKWSPYTAISAMAAGRMVGVDHVVWLDGNTLYDNGSNVGTITAGASMDIVALDDSFLIFGAAKNYIWDGDHLREQGAWQVRIGDDDGIHMAATATVFTVSAISKATTARITTSAPNTFTVGDYAYVVGGDMTQIIGRNYRVTGVDVINELYIDIDCDSTDFTTYTTGATVYRNASGLPDGDYKFYLTGTVELSDGTVLEGRPIGLGEPEKYTGKVWDTSEAQTFTVSDQTIPLVLEINAAKWIVSSVAEFSVSGTIGTDYFPGLRLYRTKAGGYDYYLENSWRYGDADLVYTAGANASFAVGETGARLPDNELGAVYVPAQYDNGSAPASTTGDVSAQRCLVNSQAYPDRVYWSSLDGIEYFNTNTGWDKRPDVVTGIIGYRDGFVVFSCDRIWYCRFSDNLPSWEEIPTPVGTVWPKAMWVWRGSVVWLRDDGLWAWGGSGEPRKISRKAFQSITDPQSVTGAGEILYVSGSEKAYVAISRDSGVEWHECDGSYPMASGSNGKVYAASTFGVYELFAGVRRGGRLRSKQYGNNMQMKSVRAVIDMEGETVPTLWVNGNRQSDTDGHDEETRHGEFGVRKLARISIPRLNNQYVELMWEVTGDVDVHGYWIEVAR